MKMLFFAVGISFLFLACSSSNDEKNFVQSNGNSERIEGNLQQSEFPDNSRYIAQLNDSLTHEPQSSEGGARLSNEESSYAMQSNERAPVELVFVDTCFAHYEYDNPTANEESFLAKQNEDGFIIRVLGNTQCPPAEKPDYLEYSYEDDTLVLSIDKKDRSFDVTSSCMYWAEILIKGDISFNKIQINGNTFSVTVE